MPISIHALLRFLLPLLAAAPPVNWILHITIRLHHADVLKRPSAEGTRNVAVVHIVTAAILPAVFGVFAHGAFLAFGGSLANWIFRVNARTSFRNPRRKCTEPDRDAGPSNRGTGNRLCRSGGRRRSRQ